MSPGGLLSRLEGIVIGRVGAVDRLKKGFGLTLEPEESWLIDKPFSELKEVRLRKVEFVTGIDIWIDGKNGAISFI